MIFDRDSWQEIFSTLKKNKLRSVLTMLGVGWGIFMLVIMLGCGNGLRTGVIRNFVGVFHNQIIIWPRKTTKTWKSVKPGRVYFFTHKDLDAAKSLKGCDLVCPRIDLDNFRVANNTVRGAKAGSFFVHGDSYSLPLVTGIRITQGRFLNVIDLEKKRKICVIGTRVAEVLFPKQENPIGKFIKVGGVYFEVVGIRAPLTGGQEGLEDAQSIHLPITTFERVFHQENKIHVLNCKANAKAPIEALEKSMMQIIKYNHNIAPNDDFAVGHWNLGAQYAKFSGLFDGIEVLVWIVGIGSLFAGVIGISNIMLIVVNERTKEIGIKRAIGATPNSIITHILLESLFITLIAGYTGLAAGIFLLELLSKILGNDPTSMFANPSVDLNLALKALGVIIAGGLFAGFIPARKAIRIAPVEALRHE